MVSHEPTPDVFGAHVFGAQKNYAGVDADDVGVGPTRLGVEGVDEAVLAIAFGAVSGVHRFKGAGGQLGGEHQGAAGGGGDHSAVDVGIARWTAPGKVAFCAVRCSDAPDVWAKGWEVV